MMKAQFVKHWQKHVMLVLAFTFVAAVSAQQIKVAHLAPVDDPRHAALESFAETVETCSDGDLDVRVYPDSTLGSERELFEQASSGITEMALIGGIISNFTPEFSIVDMPYLWETQEQLHRFLESPTAQSWVDEMTEEYGVGIMGYFNRNPRVLVTTDKPIHSMDDLAGLKVRVPEIRTSLDTWRAFGVEPTPMPASEFYQALRTGAIDAMENPVEVHYNWRIYEVADYLARTEHNRAVLSLIYDTSWLEELPEEHRQCVVDAADETVADYNQTVGEQEAELYDLLEEEGMTITDPDTSAFVEAAEGVWQNYVDQFGQDVLNSVIENDF